MWSDTNVKEMVGLSVGGTICGEEKKYGLT